MALRRRDLLIAAGFGALAVSLPKIAAMFRPKFAFEPLEGVAGFRRLPGGAFSGATNISVLGIDTPTDTQEQLRADAERNPCRSLFGTWSPGNGQVPIAVFTDYNCPYCPEMSDRVITLSENDPTLRVFWFDLPVLGAPSVAAARAAIAAGYQGQYLPVHQHLMRNILRPGNGALGQLAERFGLDPNMLIRDAGSARTNYRIEESKAVAATFRIIGTPGLVVGSTMVMGRIPPDTLADLIALERDQIINGGWCA